MGRRPPVARSLVAAALLGAAAAACAHDTWFEPLAVPGDGLVRLAVGTGNRFPVMESTIGAGAFDEQGCRRGTGERVPMRVLRDTATAVQLEARLPPAATATAGGAITCWAQTIAFEVEIAPETVPLYFEEIRAPAALREAWRAMQARGVRWRERYTKHARIELHDGPPVAADAAVAAPALPAPMAMDIVRAGPQTPLRAGDRIDVRVLRDGKPLAGLAVELVSERSRYGVWLRTDADGRAAVRLPFAGRWCLRGTDLRLSNDVADRWESRFVTYVFDVAAAR